MLWMVWSDRMPHWLPLMIGLVFGAFGLFPSFGIEPHVRRRREAVTHAVTDRRLLRADPGRTEVRGLDLGSVIGVELVHGIPHASLCFQVEGDSRDWAENDRYMAPIESPMPALLDIADADAVAGLIDRLRKNAPVGEGLPPTGDAVTWRRRGRAMGTKGQ